jgi:hypothetical protein
MLALVLTWSVLTRPFAATAVPAFVVWAVRGNPHAARVKTFLATLAAGGVLVLSWNTWYFGSPFATGYDALGRAINFESPWAAGFAGTLFNPTLSLFYFFPLLALALAALAYLALRRDVLAGFALLFLAPQLYLIPRYSFWFGGPDLFARLWLRVVPVAFLLIIVAAARVQRRAAISALAFGAVSLLVLVGAKAQALAAMTDERAVYAESVARLEREDPGVGEQQHRASLAALITGRTVVARVQVDRLRTPRRFVVARRAATPVDRLPAALLGILASVVLAVQYWRLRK